MFESETRLNIAGVDVTVARRPNGSTFDVSFVDDAGEAKGFTLGFFPEGAEVDEATLREEIARNVTGLRAVDD